MFFVVSTASQVWIKQGEEIKVHVVGTNSPSPVSNFHRWPVRFITTIPLARLGLAKRNNAGI